MDTTTDHFTPLALRVRGNEVYCVTELKLMIHSHFIEILMILTILTKYVFNVSVWLTEYSVNVGSVTVRFYYIIFQVI